MQSRLAKAAFWSIAGSGSQYAVVFLLLVYLAHMLSPHDFGLMATVTIGLDLGTRIARWGQVELLQQSRYRNEESRNQSLRLSLAIGCGFMILFVVAAKPLGRLYGSDQLTEMMYLCAPVFLFSAAGSTAEALLRLQFRFKVIAVRNTVTTLIGAAVAVVLVNLGYGATALAMQRVIQAAIAGFWVWTALDWRPSVSRRLVPAAGLAREGTNIMLGTLMPLLVPRAIDLFVGFTMGPAALGLMRVGFRVSDFIGQLVVMPLVGIANTQFSTLHDDLAVMRKNYLRLTQASAVLMCPALVGLSLVAPEAMPIIFGRQWTGSVPFVEVVGLLGIVAPINYYFAPVMMALKQSRLVFRQGLVQIVLGIALAAAAAQISLVAVAIAHVIRGTIVAVYNIVDLRRYMRLSFSELVWHLAPPYLSTLAMVLVILAARSFFTGVLRPLEMLLVLSAIGASVYVATLTLGDRLKLWPAHASAIPRGLFRRPVPAE